MLDTEIKILPQTLELFAMFYHDASYAGSLRIHLIDKILIGGNHCTLALILEKDAGKFGDTVNNSYYNFYLEFSTRVPHGRHPIVKPVYFSNFHEQYEPALTAETFEYIIKNGIDRDVFQNLSLETFGVVIHLLIDDPNKEKERPVRNEDVSIRPINNHDLLQTFNNIANKNSTGNLFDPAVLT